MTRRPFVPREAAGLFAALTAESRGDAEPLRTWMRAAGRSLHRALLAAGFDRANADEAAAHVISEAWLAAARGAQVEDELRWISAVAGNWRASRLKRRATDERVLASLALSHRVEVAPPTDHDDSLKERLRAAFRTLPPPYAHVVVLRGAHGRSESQITEWLRRFRPISVHQGRKLQRQSIVMLRAALAGDDPRRMWPQRYLQKNAWIGTPIVPLETLLSVEDARTGS